MKRWSSAGIPSRSSTLALTLRKVSEDSHATVILLPFNLSTSTHTVSVHTHCQTRKEMTGRNIYLHLYEYIHTTRSHAVEQLVCSRWIYAPTGRRYSPMSRRKLGGERCAISLNANPGESEGCTFRKEMKDIVRHLHLLAVQLSKKYEIGCAGKLKMFGSLLDNALPRYASEVSLQWHVTIMNINARASPGRSCLQRLQYVTPTSLVL